MFSNKNRELVKFWTLRNAIIIIDEIQAIPRILLRDFAAAISHLARNFNTRFILMSATVPQIKALLPREITTGLLSTEYYTQSFNNRYTLRYNSEITDQSSLANAVYEQYQNGRSVLCVVNTKKTAQAIFNDLKKRESYSEVFLLSTLFVPFQRKRIIRKIKEKLLQKKPLMLISTQVIEAGVDLDFDCGYREFSPLYSIIQTAGRINRENKKGALHPFLEVTAQLTDFSPYHTTDLLKEEFEDLLSEPVPENCLLPLLKAYFETSLKRTSPDLLLKPFMENLDFQTTANELKKYFMPEIPTLVSIFIEVREGLAKHYQDRHNLLIDQLKGASLEDALAIKSKLKQLSRRLSQFIINVPAKEADVHGPLFNQSETRLCPYEFVKDGSYTKQEGWTGKESQFIF